MNGKKEEETEQGNQRELQLKEVYEKQENVKEKREEEEKEGGRLRLGVKEKEAKGNQREHEEQSKEKVKDEVMVRRKRCSRYSKSWRCARRRRSRRRRS